jgi:hypothetical protein
VPFPAKEVAASFVSGSRSQGHAFPVETASERIPRCQLPERLVYIMYGPNIIPCKWGEASICIGKTE